MVHRESIIHSLVEYCDNAILAQLGTRGYAPAHPVCPDLAGAHAGGGYGPLDLFSCPSLTFAAPGPGRLPLPGPGHGVLPARPGTACAILNGANEAAVELFLQDKIGFLDIADLVEYALQSGAPAQQTAALEDVLEADRAAREAVYSHVS